MEILQLLAAPFAVCLILTGIHCYLGLHVVARGVIFVDLALAQIAAFGAALALLFGYALESSQAYYMSLAFTFVGAGIFALSRFRERVVPQEAIIGIVYAVFSALAVLVLDRAPHGHEAIKAMLVGSILYVNWHEVLKVLVIYTLIGAFHYLFRKNFLLISQNAAKARMAGVNVVLWDFIFYITFGLVVTSSVKIAGVLLVFSYLIVPTVCAMLLTRGLVKRLVFGWGIGFLVSIFGLFFSARFDLPTGAAIVTCFGIVLAMAWGIAYTISKTETKC